VAIGETGLDFYRTEEPLHQAQKHSFIEHIRLAKEHNLALQIHDRDAHQAVVEVLLAEGAPQRTVFHCFSGDRELAEILIEHGWYASFAGTVTFKNSAGLREALRVMPRSNILIETDTPFLTPTPYRGKPNSPYMIPYTLRAMAVVLEMDENLLAAQLCDNTHDVYGRWDDKPLADLGSVLDGH
jgi:TatD DNase family protein